MRLRPAAIVGVLLGMALILPSCGGEETAAVGTDANPPKRGARAATRVDGCPARLGRFVSSMDALRKELVVGLSYRDYLAEVNEVRAIYAGVEEDALPIECLVRVGTPAERALNAYIDAVNSWGDCLATVSCGLRSLEPKLQRQWREAADHLAKAQSGQHDLRSAEQ